MSRARGALGRAAARGWYGAMIIAGGAGVALGLFRDLPDRSPPALGCALFLATLLSARVVTMAIGRGKPALPGAVLERARIAEQLAASSVKAELELGGLLLLSAYAAFQATGGARSLLHPLAYALVAFAVTFQRRAVGIPMTAWAMVLECSLYLGAQPHVKRTPDDTELLVSHLGFLALFALLHAVLLGAEVIRQRREHRARVDGEVRRMRDEARDFRLISTQLPTASRARTREEEQEIIAAASVDSIHQALFYTLELLKKSLDLHTAVLLWLDESGERFTIKELASDSDAIQPAAIDAWAGLLGAIVKDRAPRRLRDPKPEHLPYYSSAQPIGAVCGVPLLEGADGSIIDPTLTPSSSDDTTRSRGHLRAILCADRLVTRAGGEGVPSAEPFDARDEQLLAGAAREILRAVRAERIFVAVERGKYEHEALFRASEQLGRALTPEQVWETAFAAARELCDFDFAAITRLIVDGHTRRHAVVAATGDGRDEVEGLTFADNAGLVAMAVKNRHALPAVPHGEARHIASSDQPVFVKKTKLRPMESLLVLPLIAADEAIGTLVLGARAARRFGKDKRELLGVIANQLAVSTKNAELYRAMEQMATTDGLTGLVNHRSFQERFADLLARAERQGTTVTLLLTDIDHFKKVNDTYGHPTGDVVLKGVAATCRSQVRKIDVAARYGGEEFAIVLDGTDRDGALQLAERIRKEVAAQSFHHAEKGNFNCTLSLGIASYPDDGKDPKTLIGNADQALYHAKHSGRNRAVAWAHLEGKQLLLRAVK